ncbi:MAG: DUF2461 domain-containing protein [Alphaproteobacteria bacterium]|nr:DUF2461 domain-containing protein [Alphaproteobacteria bacterium]
MNAFPGFPKGAQQFVAGLVKNNDRDWFEAQKESYQRNLLEPAKSFVMSLGATLQRERPRLRAEPKVNGSIMRLNRDTRFSKDKRPYKDYFGFWFWEGDAKSRECSGFFIALTAKSLVLGSGMHGFTAAQLASYRRVAAGEKAGRELRAAVTAVTNAGATLGGSHYKRVPAGISPDHQNADLLKHNGLFAYTETRVPAEWNDQRAVTYCAKGLERVAPIHDWLVAHL